MPRDPRTATVVPALVHVVAGELAELAEGVRVTEGVHLRTFRLTVSCSSGTAFSCRGSR
jgi:hypothetical protein